MERAIGLIHRISRLGLAGSMNRAGAIPFFSIFIGAHMVMLPEFAAEIPCICKSCFFCYGGNSLPCSVELLSSLCQSVLDEVCYRRSVDEGFENL